MYQTHTHTYTIMLWFSPLLLSVSEAVPLNNHGSRSKAKVASSFYVFKNRNMGTVLEYMNISYTLHGVFYCRREWTVTRDLPPSSHAAAISIHLWVTCNHPSAVKIMTSERVKFSLTPPWRVGLVEANNGLCCHLVVTLSTHSSHESKTTTLLWVRSHLFFPGRNSSAWLC